MSIFEVDVVERWLPVIGAEPFYSVSSIGRVRSHPVPERTLGKKRGRILSPSADTKGYPIVQICIPGCRPKTTKVHRLVAAAFLGPANGRQVNHINGVKTDNRVDNLEYVSCKENIRHCWRSGLHSTAHCTGEASTRARLDKAAVLSIRTRWPSESLRTLAREYGVVPQTIAAVVHRRTWRHV